MGQERASPPGRLTTHVLDTAAGVPAAGVRVALFRCGDEGSTQIASSVTDADGRCPAPLLAGEGLIPGEYDLVFDVGDYFRDRNVGAAFFDRIPVRIVIADPAADYHVPLLVSPFGYTTYRGS